MAGLGSGPAGPPGRLLRLLSPPAPVGLQLQRSQRHPTPASAVQVQLHQCVCVCAAPLCVFSVEVIACSHLEGMSKFVNSQLPKRIPSFCTRTCKARKHSGHYMYVVSSYKTSSYIYPHRLQKLGALDYPGGIPTSLHANSTQQWDFPNVWAPLQWFPVLGWFSSEDDSLRAAARDIAEKWINTTFTGWENNKTMFEKVGGVVIKLVLGI